MTARKLEISTLLLVIGISMITASGVPVRETVSTEFGYWARDGRDFVFLKKPSLALNHQNKMVMVSFKPGSSWATKLRNDKKTLAFSSSLDSAVGRAIVSVNSQKELDQLASLAHQNIGACGAIELLDPNLTTVSLKEASSPALPTSVKAAAVTNIISGVSGDNLRSTVAALESLGTRHHSASSNVATNAVKNMFQPHLPDGSSLNEQGHIGTTQKSLVVRIPGQTKNPQAVILAAHLDSINPSSLSNAPGADDDASGIAALVEVIRVIKASGATFMRSIELHAMPQKRLDL